MSESILIIGPHRQVHDLFNPLWVELEVEKQRFTSTDAAIEVLDSDMPPGAVLISYPLWDSSVEDILAALGRIFGPEPDILVVLLAPQDSLFEVAALEDRGVEILSEGKSPEELRKSMHDLLVHSQRAHPRFIVRMTVQVGAGSLLRACQTEDISLSGMLIRTSEEFPIGADLKLEFDLNELEFVLNREDGMIRCQARVVRLTDPENEQWRCMGVHFLSFEDEGQKRLEEFLSK